MKFCTLQNPLSTCSSNCTFANSWIKHSLEHLLSSGLAHAVADELTDQKWLSVVSTYRSHSYIQHQCVGSYSVLHSIQGELLIGFRNQLHFMLRQQYRYLWPCRGKSVVNIVCVDPQHRWYLCIPYWSHLYASETVCTGSDLHLQPIISWTYFWRSLDFGGVSSTSPTILSRPGMHAEKTRHKSTKSRQVVTTVYDHTQWPFQTLQDTSGQEGTKKQICFSPHWAVITKVPWLGGSNACSAYFGTARHHWQQQKPPAEISQQKRNLTQWGMNVYPTSHLSPPSCSGSTTLGLHQLKSIGSSASGEERNLEECVLILRHPTQILLSAHVVS